MLCVFSSFSRAIAVLFCVLPIRTTVVASRLGDKNDESPHHNHRKLNPTNTCPPEVSTVYGSIVIGAGLAGVSAAKTLKDNDIPFLVLEMRDEIGGRMRSYQHFGDSAGAYYKGTVELGANWLNGGSGSSLKQPVQELATEYGVDYFLMDFTELVAFEKDSKEKVKQNEVNQLKQDVRKALECANREGEALYAAYYAGNAEPVASSTSLRTFLKNKCDWDPESDPTQSELLDKAFEAFEFINESLCPPEDISLFEFPQFAYGEYGNDDNFVKDQNGGIQRIPTEYARQNGFDTNILHGWKVVEIDYSTETVEITVEKIDDDTLECVFQGETVIFTPSVGVLTHLDNDGGFTPPLSPGIADLPLEMGTWYKIIFQWGENEVFWPTDMQYIVIATENENECSEWLNFDFSGPGNENELFPGSRMLACFMDQKAVDLVLKETGKSQLDYDIAVTRLLNPLKGAFGDIPIPEATHVLITDWANDDSSYGSWEHWKFGVPDAIQKHQAFYAPRNGRLFLSGTGSCLNFLRYMHGAFEGGRLSANWVSSTLVGDPNMPDSPCFG